MVSRMFASERKLKQNMYELSNNFIYGSSNETGCGSVLRGHKKGIR
jgi:hypothetical protein